MTNIQQHAHPARLIIPIFIGLGVVGFFCYKEFEVGAFQHLTFTWRSVLWLLTAVVLMAGRDFGYMWRLRLLCHQRLKWKQVFRVIMLWEFTSAVTPFAVGGTSVAVIFVHKEGETVGRSSAAVMTTSLLDEIYFILMFPLILLFVGSHDLFDVSSNSITNSLLTLSWIGYALKLAWVLLLSYGMFVSPTAVSKLIVNVFKLPVLRRWKAGAEKAGADIIVSSAEFKQQSLLFWAKAFFSTFISWTSRYLVVNAIFMAFFVIDDHLLLFARHLVMWLVLLVMPTPGGSGFAELIFKNFMGSFIPFSGLTYGFALLWRLISYYPYLIMGAIIFPRWIAAKFLPKTAAEITTNN
jgi:uncharacterized protein (TIRG00374 family)